MTTRSKSESVSFTQQAGVGLHPNYIDPNILRWVHASIATHFDDYKSGLKLYLEGAERDTGDETNFAEIRVDGPLIEIPQKGIMILIYDINVLIQSHLDPTSYYKMQDVMGVFVRGFTFTIPVYRYGIGPLDDQSFIECLRLHDEHSMKGKMVEVNNFGIVRQDTRLTQATIEGHYRLTLEDSGVFNDDSN